MTGGLFDRLQKEMEAQEKAAGLSMAEILTLPESERRLFNWMMREGEVSLADVVLHEGQDETHVRSILARLVEKGFVRQIEVRGDYRYKVRLAPKKGRDIPLDIWQTLDEKVER
ncbi:MAG: hypothetical protein ACOX87_00495 [Chloroflexota bacterium]